MFLNILLCILTTRNVISLNISSFHEEKGVHPRQSYESKKLIACKWILGDFCLCFYCFWLLTIAFLRYCWVSVLPSWCHSVILGCIHLPVVHTRWSPCNLNVLAVCVLCYPRGFLLRQDITCRRLFADLACVCWEPCWGWEGINTCREIVLMLAGGSRGVTSSPVLCAYPRFYLWAPATVGFF